MKTALSLAEILARPDIWCADRLATSASPALASGFAVLDKELPGGGWPRGALTEILADGAGFGECSLLLPALAKTGAEGRWSLLIAPPQRINGPAWAARGIDLARLAVVSPTRPRDALWAAEHALASGALGSLLCWTAHIDAQQLRRLQLAAAASQTLAFLFRPTRAQSESSAAPLRLLLAAGSRGALTVTLLKRRGPPCAHRLTLDLPRPLPWRADHEPHETHEAHEFNVSPDGAGSALARPPFAAPGARSQRPLAVA